MCGAVCLCRPYRCTGKGKRKFTNTNVLIEEDLDIDDMWNLDVDVIMNVFKFASGPVAPFEVPADALYDAFHLGQFKRRVVTYPIAVQRLAWLRGMESLRRVTSELPWGVWI